MNMKKAIAGVFAGAVAISAVATTMASAKTVSYAPVDKTIDLTKAGYYYAEDYTDTITQQDWIPTTNSLATDTFAVNFTDVASSVDNVKITITNVNTGKVVVDAKQLYDSGDADSDNVVDSGETWTGSYTFTAAADQFVANTKYSIKVAYAINPKNTKKYTNKSIVKDYNTSDDFTVATVATNIGFSETYSKTATFSVSDSNSVTIDANEDYFSLKGLDEDYVEQIAAALEGRTKAQLILNFADPDVDDDEVTVTMKVYGTDFVTSKIKVDYDAKNDTATFNWIDFIKSATSNNTVDDVTNRLSDIAIRVEADDVADGSDFTLKSITVKGPAESVETLSAGESVADTTAAITTAATSATTTEATTAASTAAASNPKTGNAPVALAVIPVAIAAAAIIAKKRG